MSKPPNESWKRRYNSPRYKPLQNDSALNSLQHVAYAIRYIREPFNPPSPLKISYALDCFEEMKAKQKLEQFEFRAKCLAVVSARKSGFSFAIIAEQTGMTVHRVKVLHCIGISMIREASQ